MFVDVLVSNDADEGRASQLCVCVSDGRCMGRQSACTTHVVISESVPSIRDMSSFLVVTRE